ncbi:MAG: hypothetical protein DI555_06945 [Novosphingobium pentaromativorans]|uniref:Uncharacterized protein n=1 Tax=Novosphingobium pentaromativorans TaxID=205844 RepID=A0A2W5QDV0_9SPHN|nr:MAG: hypothetical protein DI555_06945 [Novosphingobium pentaromativorans]
MIEIDTDKLRALDEAATPGPWERDSEYDGDGLATSGGGCSTGWHNFFIGADVDGKWRTLLDTVNSDHKLIEDDRDENGGHSWDAIGEANTALIAYLRNSVPAILAMAEARKAWAEAVATIMARCEALEDEAADELVKAESEHAQGYWRGQKRTAKSIRRELHDLTRALRSGEREGA